jgi:phosphoribosyl-ATP pyrophosphohydrolase/phosphoribosyl-AMP cyclohydrolase
MEVDFSKYADGLVPAIVQDEHTRKVLMLGFMNQAALDKTQELKRVTFYSRSKKRLWTKGEESGHFLNLRSIAADCDQDTLLIQALPEGPVCHTGTDTCWGEKNEPAGFLSHLESVIRQRKDHPEENSYVSGLFKKGINKIAQKVGEESVELIIESKDRDDALFLGEAADLLFHYLILLQARGHNLDDVSNVLKGRERKK